MGRTSTSHELSARELTKFGGNVVKMAEAGGSPMEIESKSVQPAAVPAAPKQSGYELPWLELILMSIDNGCTVAIGTP